MDFGGTFNTNCIRLNLNGQKLNGSTNPSGGGGQENYVKIAISRLEGALRSTLALELLFQ